MSRSVRRPLFASFACAAAIAPLAVMAYSLGPAQRLDLSVFLDLRRESGPAHALGAALVNLGDLASLLVLLAAVCVLALCFGRRREALAAVVLVGGANITTQGLKTVLEHARTKTFEHGFEMPWATSFPSGHTTAAASIAVALLLVVPATYRLVAATVGLALTAAVGISVVVLGWHYPSDVLGGLLVVGTWGFAAMAWLRSKARREGAAAAAHGSRPRHLAVSTD
jgi:membrane-associated phospholipid phosphatase